VTAPQLIARTAAATARAARHNGDRRDGADGGGAGQRRGKHSALIIFGVLSLPLLAALAIPVVVMSLLVNGGGSNATQAGGGYGTGLKPGTVTAQYEALVAQAGTRCDAAPASIIAAQIEQESNWDPRAVSAAGAQGISQFLPTTWPSWSNPGESPFDPAAAIPAQAKYDCALAGQMQRAQAADTLSKSLDVTSLMLAAYNAGPGAVLAAHGIPDNGQTPDYVSRITARAAHFADSTGAAAPAGSFAAKEISYAKAQLGKPYAWAGGNYTGPTRGVCAGGAAANDCNVIGFDCSGLVMFAAYQASGGKIQLPHEADSQTRPGAHATLVPRAQLQPGDLIGFTNPGESIAHHVGIYLGHNQMISAPESNAKVRVDDLTSGYYQAQQWRVVRLR